MIVHGALSPGLPKHFLFLFANLQEASGESTEWLTLEQIMPRFFSKSVLKTVLFNRVRKTETDSLQFLSIRYIYKKYIKIYYTTPQLTTRTVFIILSDVGRG